MKIHLPLSWPLVGAGVLLGFPGWKIISPSPSYISRPVWRSSAGPTGGIRSAGEKPYSEGLQANMMMLKVEELVRKTHYFYTENWLGLGFNLKNEISFSFRHNAQVL